MLSLAVENSLDCSRWAPVMKQDPSSAAFSHVDVPKLMLWLKNKHLVISLCVLGGEEKKRKKEKYLTFWYSLSSSCVLASAQVNKGWKLQACSAILPHELKFSQRLIWNQKQRVLLLYWGSLPFSDHVFPKNYTWMRLAWFPVKFFLWLRLRSFWKSQEWAHCLWCAAKPMSQSVQGAVFRRRVLSHKWATQLVILDATNCMHLLILQGTRKTLHSWSVVLLQWPKKKKNARQMMCESCKMLSITSTPSPPGQCVPEIPPSLPLLSCPLLALFRGGPCDRTLPLFV